jgi:hypothetical protein
MPIPSIPAPRKHYARSWAWAIQKKLSAAYPRATILVLGTLGITESQLVSALEKGDEVYPQVRQLIHDVQFLINKRGEVGTVSDWHDFLYQKASLRMYKRILFRLDSLKTTAED